DKQDDAAAHHGDDGNGRREKSRDPFQQANHQRHARICCVLARTRPALEGLTYSCIDTVIAASFIGLKGYCNVETQWAERRSITDTDPCTGTDIGEIRHDFGRHSSYIDEGYDSDIIRDPQSNLERG